jgi:hypothetical protein
MRSEEVYIKHAGSPFNVKMSFHVIDTPAGKICTMCIKDYEISMTDKEPNPDGELTLCFNDEGSNFVGDFGRNRDNLQRFCKFVLKELKDEKPKKRKSKKTANTD